MPIDNTMADSMLGAFRSMFSDIAAKNISGENFDKMKSVLDKMEQCAVEMDDIVSFSTRLATENLYTEFSNAYSKVMAELASKEYSGNDGDEKLLAQALQSYSDFIPGLKDVKHGDKIAKAIQDVIDLGKSGITYPVFLRICEEKGLNKILQGGLVIRDGLLEELQFAKDSFYPFTIKMREDVLEAYDKMSLTSAFGVPDSFEFGLVRQNIEWKYEPDIIKWMEIIRRWDKMLEIVNDWVDSFGSFAPFDQRWADMRGMQYTLENIKYTKLCNPGFLKRREIIFNDYFQLNWDDIFTHDTWNWEMKAGRIWYSDINIEKLQKGYSFCVPGGSPPAELISLAEKINNEKLFKR
jgi:hypothetical protein